MAAQPHTMWHGPLISGSRSSPYVMAISVVAHIPGELRPVLLAAMAFAALSCVGAIPVASRP